MRKILLVVAALAVPGVGWCQDVWIGLPNADHASWELKSTNPYAHDLVYDTPNLKIDIAPMPHNGAPLISVTFLGEGTTCEAQAMVVNQLQETLTIPRTFNCDIFRRPGAVYLLSSNNPSVTDFFKHTKTMMLIHGSSRIPLNPDGYEKGIVDFFSANKDF